MLRRRQVTGHSSVVAAALVAGLLAGSAMIPAYAQTAPAAPATNAPAPATAIVMPDPPASQMAAALDFLRASGLTTGFDDTILSFVQQTDGMYANQRPELTSMINDVTVTLVPEFLKERAELDTNLAKLYTSKFSEDELKQLAAFYHSDVGQKFSKQQQAIIRDSYPVVQAWTRKLQDDIAKRIKEEVGKKGEKL